MHAVREDDEVIPDRSHFQRSEFYGLSNPGFHPGLWWSRPFGAGFGATRSSRGQGM